MVRVVSADEVGNPLLSGGAQCQQPQGDGNKTRTAGLKKKGWSNITFQRQISDALAPHTQFGFQSQNGGSYELLIWTCHRQNTIFANIHCGFLLKELRRYHGNNINNRVSSGPISFRLDTSL